MDVLIVDDSPTTSAILQRTLEKMGHRVVDVVGNGEAALRAYRVNYPDLVTMDVVMPHVDGIEGTKKIIEFDPNAVIVMVTTQDRMTIVSRALAAGARGYILQPLNLDELAEALKKAPSHRAKIVRGTITWEYDEGLDEEATGKKKTKSPSKLAPPPAPVASQTPAKPAARFDPNRPLRVLVVEDSPVTLAVMKEILAELGHTVVGTAGTGADALAAYRALKPDLVTMDIVMPDMDGIEATRLITQSFPDATVVMVTGQGWEGTIARALAVGASGYVVQPVGKYKLREVLRMVPKFKATLKNGVLAWEPR
ncbi:MAG TPA: response regulator [Magnetospirillaceae bacterium]